MKILHFADYHLGVSYGNIDPQTRLHGRVLDYLDSLDALIDYAVVEDVDLVIFAGDAYHKSNPDPTLQREFGERIVQLSEQCPIVLVVGNHDMPGSVEKASAVDVFSTLRVDNVIVGNSYEILEIETKSGTIQVGTFPYPRKQQFLDEKDLRKVTAIDIFQENVNVMIDNMSEEVDPKYPAIFVGHFSVDKAVYGSEQDMAIGASAEVKLDILANKAWDYVALGHIHKHQCLCENPPVIYAGSLDRIDFSEENDDKGFIYIEIDEDRNVSWEFVYIDARPFKTLTVDVTDTDNPNKWIISKIRKYDLSESIVRLRIILNEGEESKIHRQRILDELEKASHWVHSIFFDVQRIKRSRLQLSEGFMQLSHIELLEEYFQDRGKSGKELDDLLDLSEEIMETYDQ